MKYISSCVLLLNLVGTGQYSCTDYSLYLRISILCFETEVKYLPHPLIKQEIMLS
jgi:hypothetical protein